MGNVFSKWIFLFLDRGFLKKKIIRSEYVRLELFLNVRRKIFGIWVFNLIFMFSRV